MLNYTTYVNSIANLLVVQTSDPGFITVLPNIIDDAEQRLYRELQLLDTVTSDTSGTFVTGQRSQSVPSANGTGYVINSIYAITPASATANAGTRNPLTPASRDFLDFTYPDTNGSTVPQYFAMTTQTSFIVGPWPDQAYPMEANMTLRPAPISTTNVTTILSVYFPDLLVAASMVFGAAYQQNFGSSGAVDNPQMPVAWESHLQTLLKSAQTEEAMKRFTSQGWSSKPPAQLATPPRT